MPAFISRSFAAGTPSGSCYTIYDGVTDSIVLSDVRSSPTEVGHSPVVYPNGYHSAVWGTDKLEFNRYGYLPGITPNEVFAVTSENAASAISAGRPFPSNSIDKFLGYQGSKALFWSMWHGATGGFRILDVDDTTQWDTPVIVPPVSRFDAFLPGEESSLGPDGRIWMIESNHNRNLWVYDGSWTDLGPGPVAGVSYQVLANDDIGPYLVHPNQNAGYADLWPRIAKWNGTSFENVLGTSMNQTNGLIQLGPTGWGAVLLDDNQLVYFSEVVPYLYGGSYDYVFGIVLVDLTLRDQYKHDVMGIGFIDSATLGGDEERPYLANVQKCLWGASNQEIYYSAVGRNLAPSQIKLIRYDAALRQSDGVYASLVGTRINGRGGWAGSTDARLDLGTWWQGASGGQKDVGFAVINKNIAIVDIDWSDMHVQFRILDTSPTDLVVRLRSQVIYSSGTWADGWEQSSIVVNGANFGVLVVPPVGGDFNGFGWGEGEVLNLYIQTALSSPEPITAESQYQASEFSAEQPFSMWPMLMKSVREHDRRSPGLLERVIQNEDGLDDVWKRRIFDPATNLPTLLEVESIDDQWLPWLKSLLGFTRDLSFDATEEELRRMLRSAIGFWAAKPSELGIAYAVRMVTGNRFSIRNFFDLAFRADETRVVDELTGLDPNVLAFTSGAVGQQHDDFTSHLRVVDHGVGTLAIRNATTDPTAAEVIVGLTSWARAEVASYSDGEVSLVRIVGRFAANEQLSGSVAGTSFATVTSLTGVLNRELLGFLVEQVRAFSERIDVAYLDFMEEFITRGDLDQWDTVAPVASMVSGECSITADGSIVAASSLGPQWRDQIATWRVQGTGNAAKLMFAVQDSSPLSNHYFVEVDFAASTVELWRRAAGADTQLGSTVSVPTAILQDVDVQVRAQMFNEGSQTRLRVKVQGVVDIDVADASGSRFTSGLVGARTGGGAEAVLVKYVEVNGLPTELERFGPNP